MKKESKKITKAKQREAKKDKDKNSNLKLSRTCPKCHAKYDKTAKYCESCGIKTVKKRPLVVYSIMMFFVFILMAEIVTQIFPLVATDSLFIYPEGYTLIAEALWGLSVLVIMLLYGNSYVFYQKKKPLFKSLKYYLPLILFIVLYISAFTPNAITKGSAGEILVIILLYLTVGVTEEFLCRGWLLNEFIERYGDDRKGIILSVALSGLIFGAMHITNALGPQSLFVTVLQVIQACGSGFLFGAAYYRTKNIWANVLVHGVYDIAISLNEIGIVTAATYGTLTPTAKTYYLFSSLALFAFYVLFGLFILRNEVLTEKLENKKVITGNATNTSTSKRAVMIILVFISGLLAFSTDFFAPQDAIDYQVKYDYEVTKFKYPTEYETLSFNYKEYDYNGIKLGMETRTQDDDIKDVLVLSIGDTKAIIDYDNDKYDEVDYAIIEDSESYIIMYVLHNLDTDKYEVKYFNNNLKTEFTSATDLLNVIKDRGFDFTIGEYEDLIFIKDKSNNKVTPIFTHKETIYSYYIDDNNIFAFREN